jgi:hypothetical protein
MKRTFLLAALCATGVLRWPLRAASDLARSTLANKPRFNVAVESLDSEAQQCGLTEPQVRTDVEIRLRRSGVVVDPALVPYLYVNVNVLPTPRGCVYDISLDFRQHVALDGRVIVAATWSTGALGMTLDTSGRRIRNDLSDEVDKFLNDWLSVNPPKASEPPLTILKSVPDK